MLTIFTLKPCTLLPSRGYTLPPVEIALAAVEMTFASVEIGLSYPKFGAGRVVLG